MGDFIFLPYPSLFNVDNFVGGVHGGFAVAYD